MKKSRYFTTLNLLLVGLYILAGLHGPQAAAGVAERMEGSQGSKSGWIPALGDWMKDKGWRLGTFQSRVAGAVVGYYYYLPPAYEADTGKRYPVIYWLHGLNGVPASANPVVAALDAGIKAGTAPAMILVSCTDPTKRSMWTDSKDGRVPVETVIVQELVPHIDATFRTIATRQGRAIEGYSMGGYGAAYLGFKYPDTFGVVSILAGALHSPDTLNARRAEIFRAVFDGDSEYAGARSPWTLVRQNADKIRGRTFVRIHVGEKDGLREWNTEFHDLLAKLKIEHTWNTIPNSTHNPAEFFANWPGNLFDFYAGAFAGVAQGAASAPEIKEFVYKQTPQGDLKMHVHLPPGWTALDQRPAVVFFFGGGWRQGTVEQFRPQAEYLATRGMVTARADYRVRGRHGTTPDKCVEDAKSAVRWLRANAAQLGIDPQRLVASGGSAGGHIAACTFTIPGFDAEGEDTSISCRPNLLVLFNPVLNTVPVGERFGMGEMARRISPNHHLSEDIPPTIIFFGTEDRLNEGGKEFMQEAAKLGLDAQMHMAPGQPHGFFNRSPWREQTIFLMDQLLTANGYLRGDPTVQLPVDGLSMTKYE